MGTKSNAISGITEENCDKKRLEITNGFKSFFFFNKFTAKSAAHKPLPYQIA